jgi:hypothetical protein
VTHRILFLRAHLCGGNTQAQWLKYRVIPKSILADRFVQDVPLKPSLCNLMAAIGQNQ